MPELPEVETIRLGLQKYLVGYRIEGVEVRLRKIVTGNTAHVTGARVKGVRRFGKGLVIDLDSGYSLAIHVKLTGQLIYQEEKVSRVSDKVGGKLPNKWTHVIFKLDKGAVLYYNDLRQFGWIKIVKTEDVPRLPFFKDLGPEFLKDLTQPIFTKIVQSSNLSIKPLLMDQGKMSGVGNIYANDALFDAKIDPRRSAKQITLEETKILYNSMLKVLKKGLKYNGATELNFVNALGQEGQYQKHFLVYGREKEKCRVCSSTIKKIKLASRGTYFCPKCQG